MNLKSSIVSVSILLNACMQQSAKTEHEEDFFAMRVGHQWTFDVEGAVKNKHTSIEVRERLDADGISWFVVEPLLGDFMLLRNTDNGVVHTGDCGPDDFKECVKEMGPLEEQLVYKYPASRGEHYNFLDWGETAVTVLGQQELTVPAGTFNCILYEFNLGDDVTRHCVAPGVGLIWIQETWSTRDGQIPVILKRSGI